jgi:sarcosine oxidase subunit beta
MGGSYSPKDAQINPLELVVACAYEAKRHGAKIHTFTEVQDVETEGNTILSVKTNNGNILTNTVINAAGVWAPNIARMANLDLPIQPLKGELFVTERVPQMLRGTLIAAKYLLSKTKLEKDTTGDAPKRSVGITLVQVKHGNFIVGSTREPAGFDHSSTYAGISELAKQLLVLTPSLADIRMIRAYAGLRPITPDGYPIIGRTPELPGFIQVAGFGGDGLAMSAITAEMVTSLIDNQDHEFLPIFSLERFNHPEV